MKESLKIRINEPAHGLQITALVHRELTGKYFYRFEGANVKGEQIRLLVPREDPSARVKGQLVSHGFDIRLADIDRLVREASNSTPLVETEAARLGLCNNNTAFVTFDSVLGKTSQPTVPPASIVNSAIGCLSRSDSLDAFKKKVVPLAKRSSVAMLTMSAAFATYLLTPLEKQPFGMVIYGRSRLGKSAAQLLAGSVIGYRQEKDLLTFASSVNGLLETAALLNDHVVVINEVATADGGKAGAAQALFHTAYRLVGGRDKLRHSTYTNEHALKSGQTFSSIFLLSSERHPDSWAASAGELRDDGERARMIGVPAASGDATSIFDKPPKSGLEDIISWERRQFRRIFSRIARTHGQAYSAFVSHMLVEGEAGLVQAKAHVEEFEHSADILSFTPVKQQIISNFAVIYAGGAMASDAGLFPIKKAILSKAILGLCRSSLGEMPDPKQVLKANLRTLKKRLEAEVLVVKVGNEQKLIGRPGFRSNSQQGDLFVVRQQAFVRWFPIEADRQGVLRWLDEKGLLRGTKANLRARGGVAWAESQVTWPNKTRPRAIQIFLPDGLMNIRPTRRRVVRKEGGERIGQKS